MHLYRFVGKNSFSLHRLHDLHFPAMLKRAKMCKLGMRHLDSLFMVTGQELKAFASEHDSHATTLKSSVHINVSDSPYVFRWTLTINII